MVQSGSFRIGLTDDGVYDKIMDTVSAREALERTPGVEIAHFPASKDPVPPDLLNSFDAVLAGGSLFTLASTVGVERCSLIGRFGAGMTVSTWMRARKRASSSPRHPVGCVGLWQRAP